MGFGVAVSQLSLVSYSRLIGLIFVSLGAFMLLLSIHRYFRVLNLMEKGYFETGKIGIFYIICVTMLAATTIIVLYVTTI